MGNRDHDASFLGQKISRRKALAIAGTFGAGMALGGGGALSARELADPGQTVEFYGKHQAGIATRSRTGSLRLVRPDSFGCGRGQGPYARVVRGGGEDVCRETGRK